MNDIIDNKVPIVRCSVDGYLYVHLSDEQLKELAKQVAEYLKKEGV